MELKEYLYGLDLSMEQTGITIFDLETNLPIHISSIHTNKNQTHGKRLKVIEDGMIELVGKYQPKIISIERGFGRFNITTQVLYRVHGVINKFFHNYEQIYYPPKSVKEAILKGTATKKQIRAEIEKKYFGIVFENEDESDSFAVALTYLIKNEKIVWEKENKTLKKKPKRNNKEIT